MHATPSPKNHATCPPQLTLPIVFSTNSHQPLPLLPHGAPFRCAVLQGKGHLARNSFFPQTSSLHLNCHYKRFHSPPLSRSLSYLSLSMSQQGGGGGDAGELEGLEAFLWKGKPRELFDSDDSGGGHCETAMKPPETSSSIPSAPASNSLPGQVPVKRALGEESKSSSSKGGGQ